MKVATVAHVHVIERARAGRRDRTAGTSTWSPASARAASRRRDRTAVEGRLQTTIQSSARTVTGRCHRPVTYHVEHVADIADDGLPRPSAGPGRRPRASCGRRLDAARRPSGETTTSRTGSRPALTAHAAAHPHRQRERPLIDVCTAPCVESEEDGPGAPRSDLHAHRASGVQVDQRRSASRVRRPPTAVPRGPMSAARYVRGRKVPSRPCPPVRGADVEAERCHRRRRRSAVATTRSTSLPSAGNDPDRIRRRLGPPVLRATATVSVRTHISS